MCIFVYKFPIQWLPELLMKLVGSIATSVLDATVGSNMEIARGTGSDPMSILPASSHLEIKSFYAARDSLAFHDACTIRYNVFVAEQGFPVESEFDKTDETCIHLLAYHVSAFGSCHLPIGTLRLHPLSNSTIAKISRVAVIKPHRNHGIARRLVTVAENVARGIGMTQCTLDALADKQVVYEKLGYHIVPVDQEGLPNSVDNFDHFCATEIEKKYRIDETCVHLLAYYVSPAWGGRSVPVGTLRVTPLPNTTIAKISRVAVMKPHRSHGIARRLVSVAENVARSMGMTQCILHSQADKQVVYEKFGYHIVPLGQDEYSSDVINIDDIHATGLESRYQFLEDGVLHVKMCKDILNAA